MSDCSASDEQVLDHVTKLSNHDTRIGALENSDEKQWTAIDRLNQRLPNWAVMYISGLSLALGAVAGALYFALNYMR